MPDHPEQVTGTPGTTAQRRAVLLMPQDGIAIDPAEEIDLVRILEVVWRHKWLVLITTFAFALASTAYALMARESFVAEVVLVPAARDGSATVGGGIGGLVGLAGLRLGLGGGDTIEAAAVLKSRDLLREFIEREALLTVLFSDEWDSRELRWLPKDKDDWPDIDDAVQFFDKDVRSVSEDALTGVVTMTIRWRDAHTAAKWANGLVALLNKRMRARALSDSERNIAYLKEQLPESTQVALQQSIGKLLETETQTMMLARGSDEFAFRVVDPAQPPTRRDWPKRALIVVLGTMVGGIIGMVIVLYRDALRSRHLRKAIDLKL